MERVVTGYSIFNYRVCGQNQNPKGVLPGYRIYRNRP